MDEPSTRVFSRGFGMRGSIIAARRNSGDCRAFLEADQEDHTSTSDKENKPAQVPGDAESPPSGTEDRTVKEGVKHTDKTEPVQSARTDTSEKR